MPLIKPKLNSRPISSPSTDDHRNSPIASKGKHTICWKKKIGEHPIEKVKGDTPMESVGANLLVFGLLWAILVGGGGTLLIRNHWGLIAGSPGAVMVFTGAVLLGLGHGA
jgi:hypothetical protein